MTAESSQGNAVPEPAAARSETAGPSTDKERAGRRRLAILATSTWLVSYALTLAIFSDSLFILGIPGIIGLVTATVMTAVGWMYKSVNAVPYATDCTDPRGALRYHRLVVTRRFVLLVLVAGALGAVPLITEISYFFPLIVVGMMSLVVAAIVLVQQLTWLRHCSRALKTYDAEFRTPVEKLGRQSGGKRILRLSEGEQASPKMSARQPLGLEWPEAIHDGVWFAGDDMFGGALLVPGSGELVLVQPLEWAALSAQRGRVEAARQQAAEHAGFHRKLI
ncbi:hypothetical protein HCC61_28640 [Streptomyces sp. HNM0575]|uniref:hypothetical protein n=1 Tax=Streptomyces sp. HNM0575 TaxID=2716338 RepID=UPI00145E994E|nr:hypothetical protein [Streptomyces sp. HNM0575]NLU76545.1 hypothetical protein [Streptomyces sp. HNM0575]